MKLRVERRLDVPRWLFYALPPISILMALILGAAFLAMTGSDPVRVYSMIWYLG